MYWRNPFLPVILIQFLAGSAIDVGQIKKIPMAGAFDAFLPPRDDGRALKVQQECDFLERVAPNHAVVVQRIVNAFLHAIC